MTVQELYEQWLSHVGQEEKQELLSIAENQEEISDRFYRGLEFGTGGMRGVLGIGSNRMNIYTVGRATQGFANYLKKRCEGQPSIAIAYDSRNKSRLFAEVTACVMAANGITAHIYEELMPTPSLSYAVRELGCDAGVVVTASHNPARYNGYKAYGSDGSQIPPETADEVLAEMEKTDYFAEVKKLDFQQGLDQGLIHWIPQSLIDQYIDRVMQESVTPGICKDAGLKVVYTPLNGAGNRCVRRVLEKAGVEHVTVVPEQELPDGNFPTCPYPNPEIPQALELALALCRKEEADLLLATDPDCDRVAVSVRDSGQYYSISGNEMGVLLLDYICKARLAKGTMPQNPVAVKSIVSTRLAQAVAEKYGVAMVNVLTGFKFVGEVILGLERLGEEQRFIFGFEESCGYLSGGYVRDKDAVNASLLAVEMAAYYKREGLTLWQVLNGIFAELGFYRNTVKSYEFEGEDGMHRMSGMMTSLRQSPPQEIGGSSVVAVSDYFTSLRRENGGETPIDLPKSNVLEYQLADGCTVIVRPSGTEPKIKIYYSFVADSPDKLDALETVYVKSGAGLLGV
ncbi:phospho-sugar mutase [Oscillospiraceae bacterium MB08-C2-2]|nr:phospho-sugar mutase [Oscillospiraceae bacterium MB08-C2-2]